MDSNDDDNPCVMYNDYCLIANRHKTSNSNSYVHDINQYYYKEDVEFTLTSQHIANEEEQVFEQLCDRIHTFLLHPDDDIYRRNIERQPRVARRKMTIAKSDKDWYKDIKRFKRDLNFYSKAKERQTYNDTYDIKDDMKSDNKTKKFWEDLYEHLKQKSGMFRWQKTINCFI